MHKDVAKIFKAKQEIGASEVIIQIITGSPFRDESER